ncbi:uncharacterized protein BDR25DRAFT_319046 [Lindgomyces ingoldianus]|uniref:Uncharacterized protein n=1 Tax=Lindgomyces ingoldianus TaxID=673940 RepID=A0ACB6QD05_9PLEO|nr:uncharacterized protein BDR25DRAFT_319046 [Lindgomyces ingoldianus]KAF2464786.1 hypothetical protein BDR25DRAFT_319046 [Lindgomyces ingoldianus]
MALTSCMQVPSSFFDPITIGDFGESFIDGATGANNPVYEVWNEAQDVWPSGSLEDKVKCLVSVGTGVPSLTPFNDDLFGIGESLLVIATETEKTAERFSRDKSRLDDAGGYYRFNVLKGLEDIRLEESKQKNAIIAATDRYIELQAVFKQMKKCANRISGRESDHASSLDVGSYKTAFSLQVIPVVNKFVDRTSDMEELELALLPQRQHDRRKVFVLYGLGGIGKTQLCVEFARKQRRTFSSVFWLDSRTEDSLKESIATCASRIPEGQTAESSRAYSTTNTGDVDAVVRDVMSWLSQSDNRDWLVIFDNVDRECGVDNADPDAYNITHYLPRGDHGSVLITTRLASLEQLGSSQKLGRFSEKQAEAMFQSRYGGSCDSGESKELFRLLDGLPLAIAQASAYLRQSEISVAKYIQLYNQQWKRLMESQDRTGAPLRDYPDRSVLTTWTISYNAVRAKSTAAANLLLLWACLDNKDLWYGLVARAGMNSAVAESLPRWLARVASDEVEFVAAMRLLCSYSLIEGLQDLSGYETHPVVHRWALHMQDEEQRTAFAQLAVLIIGWAVPETTEKEYSSLQRRLLRHAHACYEWVLNTGFGENSTMIDAINMLGVLFTDRGKLGEAAKMFREVLEKRKRILGDEHPDTISAMNNLASTLGDQGQLDEAAKMKREVLEKMTRIFGDEHPKTREATENLDVSLMRIKISRSRRGSVFSFYS